MNSPDLSTRIYNWPQLTDDKILDALFPDDREMLKYDTSLMIIRGLYYEASNRVEVEELFQETKDGYDDILLMLDKLGLRQQLDSEYSQRIKTLLPNFAARSKEHRDRLMQLVDNGVVTKDNIELFLALEFGSDFGIPIISIAEKTNAHNELIIQEVLVTIANILKNIDMLQADFMERIDVEWGANVRAGISTRISEILFEFDHRLDSNNPKACRVVEIALQSLLEWTNGAKKMLAESEPIVVAQEGDTMLFHFMHPNDGLLPGAVECSPYGKDINNMSDKERQLKEGRGARLSITYDEQDIEAALSLKGAVRKRALNGRFDKSSTVKSGKIDPDAEYSEVSFDVFSHHSSSRSKKAADIISSGRILRSGVAGSYTYDLIDQSWGEREKFADLIRKIQDYLIHKLSFSTELSIGKVALELV